MSGFSDKSLDGWIMKEDGTTLGLKPSSTDTSIPQNPKDPNMRDGFLKLPKVTDDVVSDSKGFFDNNFDDVEKM